MNLVLGALRLGRIVLDKIPDMLSAQIIGRLLPEMHNHKYIRWVLKLYQKSIIEFFYIKLYIFTLNRNDKTSYTSATARNRL